jgi:hypothetical protein
VLEAVDKRRAVPVAAVTANARGAFRYAYRFTNTSSPTTYWCRAVLKLQRSYPYTSGRSRRVAVHVR